MRGQPGTKINLTVVRPGADKPLQFSLVREIIVQKPVKWEVKNGVGYININTFTATDRRRHDQGDRRRSTSSSATSRSAMSSTCARMAAGC